MSELKHQLMLNKERSWVPCYLKSEADKVIAEKDKEIRRLRRALYNACANWASCKGCVLAVVGSELYAKKWERMFNKCLKKMEETNDTGRT